MDPRFPPIFGSSVKYLSPSCKDVRSNQDETSPNTNHVEGEFISIVPKQIRSAIFGYVGQKNYEYDGDKHMALNNSIFYHEVRENLLKRDILVNANAISTPSLDVFNPMGNAETVNEIIEVSMQYTCARIRHEVTHEEEKHVQKLDHPMSLLVKDNMNAKENE